MPNTLITPPPGHQDTARQLRLLALRLMDAADCYDDGEGAEGEKIALETAEYIRQLVHPQAS